MKTIRKTYIRPRNEVIVLKTTFQLLAGSFKTHQQEGDPVIESEEEIL